jgi:hypothetical protein
MTGTLGANNGGSFSLSSLELSNINAAHLIATITAIILTEKLSQGLMASSWWNVVDWPCSIFVYRNLPARTNPTKYNDTNFIILK